MEVSGVVYRHVPCFSGAGFDPHSSMPSFSGVSVGAATRFSGDLSRVISRPTKFCGISDSGFSDKGYLQYYYEGPRCGDRKKKKNEKEKGVVTIKEKLKLLKGLSKDLSMFSQLGFGVDPDEGLVGEVQGQIISEATEVLLKQLQRLRADEKELKKKRKQEKAELKATKMKTMLDSESSSSESSDSEAGEVIDMSCLRGKALEQPMLNEVQAEAQEAAIMMLPSSLTQEGNMTEENGLEDRSVQNYVGDRCNEASASSHSGSSNIDCNDGSSSAIAVAKRIEVCMGNKCKKSGAAALMEEFERAVGVKGGVVGCKCMGKCRDGPNVRVLNGAGGIQAEGLDDSVRTPANPLCIGVGLEDVGVIMANFFGDDLKDLGLTSAA